MEGYASNTREFIKDLHPQGHIYDSHSNMIIGVLPREPDLGETMT